MLVVALALLLEGSSRGKTSPQVLECFGGGLLAIAVGNLRRDADRTLQCARDLDRFSAAEAILYLPVIQSGPAAAPAP